ncbi:MAG: 3-deoxy-D-manno-octulosonic acid transferase [bacterium]
MKVVYSLLVFLFLLVRLPRYVWQRILYGRYRGVFAQRLGFLPQGVVDAGNLSPIWIHAVSVGEVNAARPLAALLRQRHPERPIVLSTVTDTGQEIAGTMSEPTATFYFPIDVGYCVRRTIRTLNPSLVLLMETEIWPTTLRELNAQNIPVVLVNGRISDRSFPRYRLVRKWLKPILATIRAFLVQTETDVERFQQIGAESDRIRVTGSLKFDGIQVGESPDLRLEWRKRFQIADEEILIVAGSTFEGEEEIFIRVWRQVSLKKGVRLILAPRRPERFDSVADLLNRMAVPFVRHSQIEQTTGKEPVILLDRMGELASVYAAADIAFVGKSLCGVGGQNPVEAAAHGVPVLFGSHMENFRAAAEILLSCQGAVQVQDENQLASNLSRWIDEPDTRIAFGRRAASALSQHTGVALRTVEQLEGIGLL